MGKLKLKKSEDAPKPKAEPAEEATEPPVMKHFNAARETREAESAKKGPGKLILRLMVVTILIGGAVFGYKYFQSIQPKNARIETVVAAGGKHLQQMPVVWVSMLFMESPESGDLTDVRLVLRGECLKNNVSIAWPKIVSGAVVRARKDSMKKTRAEGLSSGKPPRLNYTFGCPIRVPMSTLKEKLPPGASLRVTVDLYWAGQKMHSKSCSISNWYI